MATPKNRDELVELMAREFCKACLACKHEDDCLLNRGWRQMEDTLAALEALGLTIADADNVLPGDRIPDIR